MYHFLCWIRLNNLQTAHVTIQATDHNQARLIAEAQYGQGKVINVQLSE